MKKRDMRTETIDKRMVIAVLHRLRRLYRDADDMAFYSQPYPNFPDVDWGVSERERIRDFDRAMTARIAISKAIDAIKDLYLGE